VTGKDIYYHGVTGKDIFYHGVTGKDIFYHRVHYISSFSPLDDEIKQKICTEMIEVERLHEEIAEYEELRSITTYGKL